MEIREESAASRLCIVCATAVFGFLVWLSYKAGISFYFEPENVATFWLTNGLVIGVLISTPRRWWCPLVAIQYAIQFAMNIGFSLEFAIIVTTVNTVSALGAAALTLHANDGHFNLRRLDHVFVFLGAVIAAETLNGLGGAFAVTRRTPDEFWSVWQVWSFATITGSLIVGTATVAVGELVRTNFKPLRSVRKFEAASMFLVAVLTCHLLFSSATTTMYPMVFGAELFGLLFLVWAIMRLGPEASMVLLLIISLQLVYHTGNGHGPLANHSLTTSQTVLAVQEYLVMHLMAGLIVSALNGERDDGLRALDSSRRKYQSLVENTSDWVWEVDASARITYSSPKVLEILGYEPSEVTGEPIYDLMPEEDAARIRSAFELAVREDKPFHAVQHIAEHKDGHRIVLEASGEPFRDSEGNVVGVRGTDRDITARIEAEREKLLLQSKLEASKRIESVGTMAGGVAHDLNNILGPIVALPELLKEDLSQAELPPDLRGEVDESLEAIEESARRAARIVSDLLTLGRRSRHQFESCDLSVLPRTFLDSSQFQDLKNRHPDIDVSFEAGREELLIGGDRESLMRVLANLTTNAIESIDGKGEVEIRTYREELLEMKVGREIIPPGDYAVLSVSDNGCGIDPSDIDHMFEPYFSKKGKTRHSGSGLGLAVVHGIVKDHEGYIDVRSRKGEKTTFAVYIPAKEGKDRGSAEGAGRKAGRADGGRVLIVDDLPLQRFISRRCLEPLGYKVQEAATGREAVQLFKAASEQGLDAPFDIVLLDMIMEPDFDGRDALQAITNFYPGFPAIIVSGYSEGEQFEAAQKLGASLLKKPYTKEELLGSIAGRLEAAPAQGAPAP